MVVGVRIILCCIFYCILILSLLVKVHPRSVNGQANFLRKHNSNVLIIHVFSLSLETQLTPREDLLTKVSDYHSAAMKSEQEVQIPLAVHDISQLSMYSYASLHHYDYLQVFVDPANMTSRGLSEEWSKVFVLRRLLEREKRYEWLVLVDAECVVLELERSLESKMASWNWMADLYLEEDCKGTLGDYSSVEPKKPWHRPMPRRTVQAGFVVSKASMKMRDLAEAWIVPTFQQEDIIYPSIDPHLTVLLALNKYVLPDAPEVLLQAVPCGDFVVRIWDYMGTDVFRQAFNTLVFGESLVAWRAVELQRVSGQLSEAAVGQSGEVLDFQNEYINNVKFVHKFELPARNGSVVTLKLQLNLLVADNNLSKICTHYDISEEFCSALNTAILAHIYALSRSYASFRLSHFATSYRKSKAKSHSLPANQFAVSMESSVIFTIFAGRFDRLSVMMQYVQLALDLQLIHEVHIWDFCRDKRDQKLLQKFVDPAKGIYLKSRSSSRDLWYDYYEYYYDYGRQYPNAVIIKSDDDIVFMDLLQLPSYLKMFQSNISGIMYPNIVNNGVATHFQQQELGLWPEQDIGIKFDYPAGGLEGSLWASGEKALKLQEYFLDHWKEVLPTKMPFVGHIARKKDVLQGSTFEYIPHLFLIGTRFSINMFAIRARDWYMIRDTGEDDEFIISVVFPELQYFPTYMNTNFFVSHFSFVSQQRSAVFQEGEQQLLQRYRDVFDEYVASLEIS